MRNGGNVDDDDPVLSLVEDALKMPFTVFTTSQKKTMLKWLDKLRPDIASGRTPQQAGDGGTSRHEAWEVMDMADGAVSLMDAGGEEKRVELSSLTAEQAQQLQKAFDAGDAVRVMLAAGTSSVLSVITLAT
jgi:hypothetical protein